MQQIVLEKKVNGLQISVDKLQKEFIEFKGEFASLRGEFVSLKSEFVTLKNDFIAFKGETALNFLRVDQKLQEVAEKVTSIPKMYDMLDSFLTELKTSRQEQTLLSHKVSDHENRIVKLETTTA